MVLSRTGASLTARTLLALMRFEGGVRAAAAVLESLPTIAAVRYTHDLFDHSAPLLPPDARKALLQSLRPQVLVSLNAVAREVNDCGGRTRARAVRVALQRFASTESLHVCHLVSLLSLLHCSQDRCSAFVILWSRVVDRAALKLAYQTLTGSEQERVMERLGYWHVWVALGSPHNLYFNLKMSQPEQKDIARECVRAAVRESLKAKADSKAKGYGSQVGLLTQGFFSALIMGGGSMHMRDMCAQGMGRDNH